MSTELVPAAPASPLAVAPLALDDEGGRRLVEAFGKGRCANTARVQAQGAADFALWLSGRTGHAHEAPGALGELLRAGQGVANLYAITYRADLLERGLAPGTVALRLSTLKSAVRLARTLGMVTWTLEVPSVRVQRYRDTAGPGVEGVQRMAAAARLRTDAIGVRDRALLAVLFYQGLRRAEVASLDVGHVDVEGERISVLGKGKLEREWVTAAPETLVAIQAWLAVRPADPRVGGEPLFLGWDACTRSPSGRLTGSGIAKIVARYGVAALGKRVNPHSLRHSALTALLDLGESWQDVAGFARHSDPSTLRHYDDNRRRRGSKAAQRLSELVKV